MKTHTKYQAILALLAFVTFGPAAQAAVVEWTFSAVVQEIEGNAAGMSEFGVETGTVLSATFLLDNSVAGGLIGQNVWYDGSVLDIDVSVGTFQATLDTLFPEFNALVVRDQDVDAVGVSAALNIQNGDLTLGGFLSLQFVSSNGQLVDSTLFPSIPDFLNLDPFGGMAPGIGGTFFGFQATVGGIFTTVTAEIFAPQARIVASPVPVPGALILLGSGLLSWFGFSRKR